MLHGYLWDRVGPSSSAGAFGGDLGSNASTVTEATVALIMRALCIFWGAGRAVRVEAEHEDANRALKQTLNGTLYHGLHDKSFAPV
jgi:hypothetical protein